jgi:hypothetical protein
MKWLLDEMLPAVTCRLLVGRGHDAVSVHEVNLAGAEDERVFAFAARERRIIVTENFADYAVLLEQRIGRGQPCVPVVFVRKSMFPGRGALATRIARRLDDWANAHPEPYIGPHWA